MLQKFFENYNLYSYNYILNNLTFARFIREMPLVLAIIYEKYL
jgi:hypothetical protein